MVKHTQTIRRQELTNCLECVDHFVELTLKGLKHQRVALIHLTHFSATIPSATFHMETIHLICTLNQLTGFYMK